MMVDVAVSFRLQIAEFQTYDMYKFRRTSMKIQSPCFLFEARAFRLNRSRRGFKDMLGADASFHQVSPVVSPLQIYFKGLRVKGFFLFSRSPTASG